MDFDNIEIIVSEIDGIITDGFDATDYMDTVIFKSFRTMDFEYINELKPYFTFVFLSSSPHISYYLMKKKNIPAFFTDNNKSKLEILQRDILPRYNTGPSNLLYVGSKLSDISCMNLAEISVATNNCSSKLKNTANFIIEDSIKSGVIPQVYDLLREEQEKRKRKT